MNSLILKEICSILFDFNKISVLLFNKVNSSVLLFILTE